MAATPPLHCLKLSCIDNGKLILNTRCVRLTIRFRNENDIKKISEEYVRDIKLISFL